MVPDFKKKLGIYILLVFSQIFFNSCNSVHEEENKIQPNVVLFVADDIGWNDVGYHGSEIRTPNIDKLAESGVELDQFYVYPTCSPTRAALLTGKYASRFGIGGPIAMKSKQVLPTNVKTLPGILKLIGYETVITGKWHLGLRPESGPNYYGFDYTYGYLHGQIDQYTHLYKNGDTTWHRNGKFIQEDGHATDLITKEVKEYLTKIRDKEKPFFLYVPYSVPHYPVQEEEKWIEPYKEIDDEESRKIYAASAEHMDYSMGEIISILKEQEVYENTILIFLSDNGGQESWYPNRESDIKLYGGRHGPYPKLGSNDPLKGYKASLHEGGIRVPAIINWQKKLKNRKITQIIKVTDLFPTIVSLIDSNLVTEENFDGKNIWSEVSGEISSIKERSIYLRTSDQFVYRQGKWKLIHFGKSLTDGYEELYNIELDPNEQNNLINDNVEIRKKLYLKLEKQVRLDRIKY